MKELNTKLYSNALIGEKLMKLNQHEKQVIVSKLLVKMSERQLSEQIGISHSTIHDWKTGRQDNTGNNIHISIDKIIEKFDGYTPRLEEFPKLQKLKKIIEGLLVNDNDNLYCKKENKVK